MPAKKKKKGGKGKKKKAAKLKVAAEKEEVKGKCKIFLRAYQNNCATSDSLPAPRIISACRECIEEEKPLHKFVIETLPDFAPSIQNPRSATVKGPKKPTEKPLSARPSVAPTRAFPTPENPATPLPPRPILFQPLFKSLKEACYDYMRCFHVWSFAISDDGAVELALFLESEIGKSLKVLELRSTELTPWALTRLSRAIGTVELTTLNLDYNESLSLMGNGLQCNGCAEMIRPLVSLCESSSFNAIKLDTDVRKDAELAAKDDLGMLSKVGMSSASQDVELSIKEVESSPRVSSLPPLARLDLRDNAIDPHGVCCEGEPRYEPVICMRAVKRWMISSPVVEDLNLDHNLIGDGGARELLQGLVLRKEAGLPVMRVTVTVYLSQDIYQRIMEYSTPKKKKKKGGKGKKKKK